MATLYDVFGEVHHMIKDDLEKLYIELKKKDNFDEFFIQGIIMELNDMAQIDSTSIYNFIDYITASKKTHSKFPISYKLKHALCARKNDIFAIKTPNKTLNKTLNKKIIQKDIIIEKYLETIKNHKLSSINTSMSLG